MASITVAFRVIVFILMVIEHCKSNPFPNANPEPSAEPDPLSIIQYKPKPKPKPQCTQQQKCTKPGTVCHLEKGLCLPQVPYNGGCQAAIQCPNSDDYECNNGRCVCSDAAVYQVGARCLSTKNLNEPCDRDIQCKETVVNSECDGSTCVCKDDFQLNADQDACVPETIKLTSTMDSDVAWNSEYGTVGSVPYNTLASEWEPILTGDSSISSASNFVFTQNGATTSITADLEVLNPDKAATVKRDVRDEQEELFNRLSNNGVLIDALEKTGHKLPLDPMTISMLFTLDDVNQLPEFCLQDVDCVEVGKFCIDNKCDVFHGRYWYLF